MLRIKVQIELFSVFTVLQKILFSIYIHDFIILNSRGQFLKTSVETDQVPEQDLLLRLLSHAFVTDAAQHRLAERCKAMLPAALKHDLSAVMPQIFQPVP